MEFKKHEVTRPATQKEKAELMTRLLDVLTSVDETEEEKKSVMSDFSSTLKGMNKRVIGLRYNLQTSTITQEIEVHAMVNENLGVMQYFDREGTLIDSLTHSLSNKEAEEAAAKRQLDMFGSDEVVGNPFVERLQAVTGDEYEVSVNGVPATVESYEKQRDHLAEELGVSVGDSDDEQPDTFNPAELEQFQAEALPDIRDGINGAVTILTGEDKPLPKVNKKKKPEPVTV